MAKKENKKDRIMIALGKAGLSVEKKAVMTAFVSNLGIGQYTVLKAITANEKTVKRTQEIIKAQTAGTMDDIKVNDKVYGFDSDRSIVNFVIQLKADQIALLDALLADSKTLHSSITNILDNYVYTI